MDLVSLIAACAIGVEPPIMHALVWRESGGEPWSVRIGTAEAAPYPTRPTALAAAASGRRKGRRVRVGLTGLPIESGATADAFEPCLNVTLAARRLIELDAACRPKADPAAAPMRCALARWRGSAARPDFVFADGVLSDAASGRLPNFDLVRTEPEGDAAMMEADDVEPQPRPDMGEAPDVAASPLFPGQAPRTPQAAAPTGDSLFLRLERHDRRAKP